MYIVMPQFHSIHILLTVDSLYLDYPLPQISPRFRQKPQSKVNLCSPQAIFL